MMLSSKAVGVTCMEGSSRAQRASGGSIPSRLWEMPTLFSASARESCLHDFPRQKESGLDSLGSWGGCAGTAELEVKPVWEIQG